MKKINTIAMSGIMALTLIAYSAPAYADEDNTYMLIQQSDLHPTKSDDFTEAWKTVLKHAKKHNYKYTTYVSKSGPRISMATELSSYGDIDKVMADRKRVNDAAGREFERAVKALDAATYSESSFVVRSLPEISNPPTTEDMENVSIFEVSRINLKPGNSEMFMEIMGEYKEGLEKADLDGTVKYNIYAGGVGASGSYFFQSFADNDVDMAEQDTSVSAMFKENKTMQDLFAKYQTIAQAGDYSDSTKWTMAKDLAYWPAE